LNKIIDIQLGNKKNSEAKDSNASNIFILNILFVLGLVISLVMYIMALYEVENFKEKYIVIPLILMLLIIIMGMVVMMMGLMKTRD
jgi:cytochrome c biogenesis protein CcdA